MADKNWADFYDYCLPYANDAPKPVAVLHIRSACKEFLETTTALRSIFDTITPAASTAEYAMTFASQGIGSSGQYQALSFVPKSVKIGSNPMFEITEDELDQRVYDWRSSTAGADASHFFLTWDRAMRIYPYPNSDYTGTSTITGECYINITEAATGVLDSIYNQYKEYIGYGAAERLLRMPNQRWSDIQSAEYFHLKFKRGMSKAKAVLTRGRTEKPAGVRPVDSFLIA